MAVRAFALTEDVDLDPSNELLLRVSMKVYALGEKGQGVETRAYRLLVNGIDPNNGIAKRSADIATAVQADLERRGVAFAPSDTVEVQ